jgi:hypothetical protein
MTGHALAHRQPTVARSRIGVSTRGTHGSDDTHGNDGTRPRWVKILEIVAVVAIAVALIAVTLLTSRAQERGQLRTTRVFVEEGDTLWSLAQAHPISGHTTEQTARLIAELNSLDSSELVAGRVVVLPRAADQTPMLALR